MPVDRIGSGFGVQILFGKPQRVLGEGAGHQLPAQSRGGIRRQNDVADDDADLGPIPDGLARVAQGRARGVQGQVEGRVQAL